MEINKINQDCTELSVNTTGSGFVSVPVSFVEAVRLLTQLIGGCTCHEDYAKRRAAGVNIQDPACVYHMMDGEVDEVSAMLDQITGKE